MGDAVRIVCLVLLRYRSRVEWDCVQLLLGVWRRFRARMMGLAASFLKSVTAGGAVKDGVLQDTR